MGKSVPDCPNCKRSFNCAGTSECWCLNVERTFDYDEFIVRTGIVGCVCPVCLTGKELGAGEETGRRAD